MLLKRALAGFKTELRNFHCKYSLFFGAELYNFAVEVADFIKKFLLVNKSFANSDILLNKNNYKNNYNRKNCYCGNYREDCNNPVNRFEVACVCFENIYVFYNVEHIGYTKTDTLKYAKKTLDKELV